MNTLDDNSDGAATDDFMNTILKLLATTLFLSEFGVMAPRAHAQGGVPLWTNRYDGPAHTYDDTVATAVDSSGNVVVSGLSNGSGSGYDYATIKYSSSIPSVHLDFQWLNNQLVLSWTNAGFSLQAAPNVTGTFTNLPNTASPYTNPATASQQYFRLRAD